VISPLLANVALHGLEDALGVTHDKRGQITGARAVVRYADDSVVFCESKDDAEQVLVILKDWLAARGLSLSEDKTRIVHLTEGFDFLGFTVRHYVDRTTATGYKLRITPSKKAISSIKEKLREAWRRLQGAPVPAVVARLTPLIRGWANYHRVNVASKTFSTLDNWMFRREVRYAKRRHPNKPWHWLRSRYWGPLNKERADTWVFGDKHTGYHLLKFSWVKIERHVLVKGTASADDPRLGDYWRQRQAAKATNLSPGRQKMAKKQDHLCPVCGESLFNDEETQAHHREPQVSGGTDSYNNLTLVHLYCHQQVHQEQPEPTRKWLRRWLA